MHSYRVITAVLTFGVYLGVAGERASGSQDSGASGEPGTVTPTSTRSEKADKESGLAVRVTPLVILVRSDARGLVTVPRHDENRLLRVILESDSYRSSSDVQLEGLESARSHFFYWRGLPAGSYRVTVEIHGSAGVRDRAHSGVSDPALLPR